MKYFNKMVAGVLCIAFACSVLSLPVTADAATWRKVTINDSKKYKRAWEYTRSYYERGGNKIGTMTYGYDTTFVNEDYVWTKATGCESLAEIQRFTVDTNLRYGKKASYGTYSKIELQHKNYNIMYQIKFFANFVDKINEVEYQTDIK